MNENIAVEITSEFIEKKSADDFAVRRWEINWVSKLGKNSR